MLIDCIGFNAVLAIFQHPSGGHTDVMKAPIFFIKSQKTAHYVCLLFRNNTLPYSKNQTNGNITFTD